MSTKIASATLEIIRSDVFTTHFEVPRPITKEQLLDALNVIAIGAGFAVTAMRSSKRDGTAGLGCWRSASHRERVEEAARTREEV